ncbi:Protein of unknown function [Bosea thiooxidans]|nr:DUF1488 family protein [Bosea thiooxidans]SKC08671.1 Protein of unknown function [Bosea thiooxidans]
MAFVFDAHTAPDLANWRQGVRFCMVDGTRRATCLIGTSTLRELGPDELESDKQCLAQFYLHCGVIASAAARLLGAGVSEGNSIVQVMLANLL